METDIIILTMVMDMALMVMVTDMDTIIAGTVHGITVHTIIQVIMDTVTVTMIITIMVAMVMATMVMVDITMLIITTGIIPDMDLQTIAGIITAVYQPDLHMDTAVRESTQVPRVEKPMHWVMTVATEVGKH